MIRWFDAFMAAQSNPRVTAKLVSLGWLAVTQHADDGVCSTLTINQFHPLSFAGQLDYYQVPCPSNLAEVAGYRPPIFIKFQGNSGDRGIT